MSSTRQDSTRRKHPPDDEVIVDPWLNRGCRDQRLPRGSEFLCAFDCWVIIDAVPVATFVHAGQTRDELWLAIGIDHIDPLAAAAEIMIHGAPPPPAQLGVAVSKARRAGPEATPLELLEILFRSWVGHGAPSDFLASGLVSGDEYHALIARLEQERADNAERAARNETEIVVAARELRLNPRPSGTGGDHWRANCPRTKHSLEIQARNNLFFCGYCSRGGGPEELQALVDHRAAWKARQSRS
ncbi:MAG: hypothetical protein IPM60_01965 [Rhodospirillales bacterium]|nr:hypothetical protein [Rhodospirillales bacterium]